MRFVVFTVSTPFMNSHAKTSGGRLLSLLGALAIICESVSGQTCTVNWTNVHQQIDGFGACSAFIDVPMTSAQAATLFGTNNGQIGFSLWRVKINTNQDWSTETTNAAFAHQYGAKVLGTPWTPPASMKSNNNGIGGTLNTSQYGAYASYLNLAANSIGLDYVSMQNEPDAIVGYESCSWTGTNMANWCASNAPAVGRPIVMPESESFNTSLSDPTLNNSMAASNVTIIAGHIYGAFPLPPYTNALAHGKHIWMTEHYNTLGSTLTNWASTNILSAVHAAWEIGECMNEQMSAYIWWRCYHPTYAYDDLINGATPVVTGYAVAQFAHFIRPGYVRIDVSTSSSNLFVTAFKATNSGSFAIVAVNTNAGTSIIQTFNLTNFPAVSSVTPWITSANMSLSNQTPVAVNSSSFTYTLPAQCVITFVGQGAAAPASITISNAAYNPSGPAFVLTWNSTAGATYSVFRTNLLGAPAAQWPILITGYPAGGATGGSLSYTDNTATVSPAFYRVSSP
jgi:glucuronoarabinoxylan endo-1,4-beta-xylanase